MKAAKTEQQTCEAQKEHYEKQLAQIEPIVQQLEQTLADYPRSSNYSVRFRKLQKKWNN